MNSSQIITNNLTKSHKEFKDYENRTNFFQICEKLYSKDLKTEAQLLLLATWNFAAFRYVTKTFDIEVLKKTMNKLSYNFLRLKNEDIRNIDFANYRKDIETIYNELSLIDGIKYTGAPKLMHLENPNLFVMWDTYIRGEKSKKYYKDLEVTKNNLYSYKRYGTEGKDYVNFLEDMQNKFKFGEKYYDSSPLAKVIDEFNYLEITLKIQHTEKAIKKSKKLLYNKNKQSNKKL